MSLFQGYSYIAPSILFSENQITVDLLRPSLENRPEHAHVCMASQFKVGAPALSSPVILDCQGNLVFRGLFPSNGL